ncbi:uncharacterized protein LOC117653778 isoform X2 [Thrips palmi]|uniref:Uncharacterized protein LOC117653778 isoform X2 n=1 Tax=Thrips palmi TaxID=161013 RepID=A0A6P9ABR5_THRPL|nr:uncharacterized protein LOC117653778 isoform X2 [Thrips palmi]
MNSSWDEKLPAGLRFMLTKTTKGRIGLIIGQHKFRKAGAQKDGTLVFRCSLKDCPARVNLDAAMRRVLRIRSTHTHPGRDLSDIISARLPSGLISSDGQLDQEDKIGRKSQGSKRQQMQEQSGSRDDPSSLEATFGMGGAAGMTDHPEAGPSGYMDDDVRVKMEPEWVDAGALEPNCELEGQFEDNQDFNASYSEAGLSGADNQNFQMYNSQQQSQSQQLPLIQDAQDPVKLHVPGKPNLTITVAPTRQGPSQSSNTSISTPPPPPLHLLNPLLNRKRGRPRGSAYGSYSESDDRVTTILTDSIIASQKLEKMGVTAASAYRPTPVNATAMPSSLVKPRSRDPEAVRAAEIVNGAQNRSGPRVTEELEKVHLKLRQEVLALEVQNLKAEREKLKAYRRNVAIRREIMALHLQLGKGFPSECASSGRGFETMDTYDNFMDTDCDVDFSPPTKDPISLSKKLPNVSITRQQAGQSPKISIRKSLQTSSQSPNASPMSMSSSTKGVTPPPASVNKPVVETKDQGESSQSSGNKRTHSSDNRQTSTGRRSSDNRSPVDSVEDQLGSKYEDNHKPSVKSSSDHQNNQENESKGSGENFSQSGDTVKDELVPLDSVSSDLSIEMLSEPGSSQWTTQSSAPMTEHEGFDDIHFEGDDSYDNTGSIGEFSGEPVAKEPPDGQYSSFAEDPSSHKRRRVENMWEPDEPL